MKSEFGKITNLTFVVFIKLYSSCAPNPNTNPNPKLSQILTLFSCFMLFSSSVP